jgi:hypothetical protein
MNKIRSLDSEEINGMVEILISNAHNLPVWTWRDGDEYALSLSSGNIHILKTEGSYQLDIYSRWGEIADQHIAHNRTLDGCVFDLFHRLFCHARDSYNIFNANGKNSGLGTRKSILREISRPPVSKEISDIIRNLDDLHRDIVEGIVDKDGRIITHVDRY